MRKYGPVIISSSKLVYLIATTLNLSGSGQQGAPSGIITNFSVHVVNSAIYMTIKLHKVILYSEYNTYYMTMYVYLYILAEKNSASGILKAVTNHPCPETIHWIILCFSLCWFSFVFFLWHCSASPHHACLGSQQSAAPRGFAQWPYCQHRSPRALERQDLAAACAGRGQHLRWWLRQR